MAWHPWRLDDFNDAWLRGGFFIVNLSVDVSLIEDSSAGVSLKLIICNLIF